MRIDRIKLITEMARKDMTSIELARKADVSRSSICSLRSGKSCAENTIKRVADALGVSVDRLR